MATRSVFSRWENESPGKLIKNEDCIEPIFSTIFTKMILTCLTVLTLVIDDLENQGQDQTVQKGSVLKRIYF